MKTAIFTDASFVICSIGQVWVIRSHILNYILFQLNFEQCFNYDHQRCPSTLDKLLIFIDNSSILTAISYEVLCRGFLMMIGGKKLIV